MLQSSLRWKQKCWSSNFLLVLKNFFLQPLTVTEELISKTYLPLLLLKAVKWQFRYTTWHHFVSVDGFMGRGLTSGGQVSGCVFSAAVCKIQASKRFILPSVLKDKRSCFSQSERSAVQLPLGRTFALHKYNTLKKPYIVYILNSIIHSPICFKMTSF